MKLEFEWEEHLFRGLLALWKRVRPDTAVPVRAEAARLEPGLSVLAGLIAEAPTRLLGTRGGGGLRAGDLLVPEPLDLGGTAEQNREALVVRVLVGAMCRRLGFDRAVPTDPDERAWASLEAGRRATEVLAAELPEFRALFERVVGLERLGRGGVAGVRSPPALRTWESAVAAALDLDAPWERGQGPAGAPVGIWGELVPAVAAEDRRTGTAAELDGGAKGTERAAKHAEVVERTFVDEERAKEEVIQHVFEKVETLDEHRGQVRRMDGSDELQEHLEALDELDLRSVIRGGERAESLYRAEIGLDADVPDVGDVRPDEAGVAYDEWDAKKGTYKKGWCTVYPTPMGRGDARWAAEVLGRRRRLVEELTHRLLVHRTRRSPLRGQRDGEDLDLDALVDGYADQRAGRGPPERVYLRSARRQRSFATTVLLDVSLSTDAWIASHRVLDVAREAALVLGEVADRLGDSLQILAFASHTRNRCRVWTVRGWDEPWALGRARLGALRPQGYTRIGPALRHAAASLAEVPADRRLLLFVSDGKPTDYDRYEGRYGVADVRQALREAAAAGVCTHALAVDAVAKDHLPAMLGPGAWDILPNPDRLSEALTTVYGRLTG